jgi:predicted protein tyrosine phosphatase
MSKEPRPQRLLFVCTANVHRSRTAEDLYRENPSYEARSAGTDVYDDEPDENPLTDELLAWADIVFVMEPYHRKAIEERFLARPRRIVVLNIEDRYDRGEPQLVRLLQKRLSRYL